MTSRRRPRVEWTTRAVDDLREIRDYIAASSPVDAERWIQRLMDAAERAAGAPLAGRRVPELARDDIREVIVRAYRIVYRVCDGRIEVLTVFEGHRRLPIRKIESS